MSSLRFEPFSDAHVDPAGELLAERHRRHRAAEPLLADVGDFPAQVANEWKRGGTLGAVALDGGRLVGYLVASPKQFTNTGLTWMVVDFAGHAVAGDAELVRDLYGFAADAWLEHGHTRHCAYVPASDPALIHAWFRLCFGASGVTAVREVAPEEPADSGLVIRDGTPDDIEATARLNADMASSMEPGPSFSGMRPYTHDDYVEDWRGTWDNADFKHFVAERDGRIVGHYLMYRRPRGDLRIPESSIDLASASTEVATRGSGVGRALMAHVLDWAHAAGYRAMTTDWRMTNLLASRFWPKRGFRPTYLRMYRSIP